MADSDETMKDEVHVRGGKIGSNVDSHLSGMTIFEFTGESTYALTRRVDGDAEYSTFELFNGQKLVLAGK